MLAPLSVRTRPRGPLPWEWAPSSQMPGARLQSDAELESFARANVRTAMHPAGSCAMGAGDDAVLDAQLRVRGIEGLRVADASATEATRKRKAR